jgi:hypothetical protein
MSAATLLAPPWSGRLAHIWIGLMQIEYQLDM